MSNLHISLHDVSPAFSDEIERALALCDSLGLQPALLVVPDHHERAPLREAPRFVDQLRARAKAGHEIFLHGYTHRADPPRSQAPRARAERYFRQRVVSAGEAEFASLTQAEAAARLDRGLSLLAELELPVHGFVAPAWSFAPWLVPMLAEREIAYTEDHLRVLQPTASRWRPSLVLNFASRSRSRIATTTAYCRLARPLARALPTRVALHPGDFRVPLLRSEARSLLRWAQREHTVVRATALLD